MYQVPGYSKDEAAQIEHQLQLNLASRHAAASPDLKKLFDRYGWSYDTIERHVDEVHKIMWNHHLETHFMAWQCQCGACKEEQRRVPNFEVLRRRVLGKV